ncbi:Rib/alpha-like domain-containing protein [Tractidigestivibacter sp.]|uniref:Rib/alpha-like domain-containing protein n=2 Tax=Tractidigestivibacter sp. TaxID=2847320 RepID=UPI002A9207E9|nr:Rib/alpha-like domain-containing protein [Tractidigestivibacter sp.]MDY5271462.1 Rib/alpha-like domain-containing protein [Tractidigestivibacter sp.]
MATEDAGTEAVAPITAAATRSMGDRDASGNTWVETPGYTKSGKYNFSDLEFAPEDLTGDITLDSNQINFEIYGKHNIAASGNNWEIRLQIDERIASHITEIKVDPNAGPSAGRRTLTRISDELGRPTNIWKVNYIRASNGLFAGAETTDTQTAPNGAITLDTNLREILTEIGHDKLTSDRLLHRIYLVSHQDNDQIVAGIESSGYFVTGDNETLNNLAVSENNPDQFKHGSVSATYVKPNTSTSDNTGTTGPSGAIVVDHKLTKESNFAYGLTAKGTPWNLEFKVDPRLVPYTQGIELHKVDASKVAYDVGYTTGTKVENLSIEKDPTRANYGQGTITNNDLTQLVNWSGGSPRPVVIRYVIKLTKPLNEILKEMKGAAGVEGNAPFGDDLIFDAWVTDSNHDLINNTFGSGFYYLQDIDGDSTPDDEEQQHQTSPYVGTPKLNKVYDTDTTVKGQVYLDELAGGADQKNTVRLIAKDGTLLAEQDITPLEEGGTPKSGVVEFTFNNVDATKLNAGEDLTVQVVSKGYDEPEEGTTTILEAPKAADKQEVSRDSTPSAKDAIKNNANLPEDATYEWKTAPDTSAVATDVPGTVTVTIDDRTFDVDVKYDVVATNADDYAPAYGGVETAPGKEVTSGAPTFSKDGRPVDLGDVPLADAGPFAVGALDPSRGSATVTDGGVVTFAPAAGVGEAGPETVAVPVEVTYADGSKETVELVVTVGRDVYGIDEGGAVPDGYHRVTLVLGAGTALKDPAAKTHFAVRDGKALGGSLPEVEATEGYKDAKWPDGAASTAIERDETFTSSATELLSHRYEPKADDVEKEHGAPTTEDDVKGAVTVPGYPADGEQPRVTVDDPGQLPDGNTPGDHRVDVTVTYPDGSTDHAQVTVTVTVKQEGFKATVKNPPAQIEGQPVADNTTVISANKGFTVVDVTTNGANAGLSIDANGNLVGTPSGLTWGDKDSATYEEQTITLTAEVTSEDGKSTETVRVAVVVQRDTDGDKEPDATDKNDDNDGYGDEEEIKKGSDPKDANSVPQVAKTETAAMKTGPDKVKKPTNSLPKTGDATTGAAAGLVAAAGGTLLLLGLRKKKEEGSEQE